MEQILIQGALLSGLYALIALGFTMIFGVGRVLNLAHAGYVMVAGYIYFWATYMVGLPVVAGFAIAIAVSTDGSCTTPPWFLSPPSS